MKGKTITMGAMGRRRATVYVIRGLGANCLLRLKGNRHSPHDEAKALFQEGPQGNRAETGGGNLRAGMGHGTEAGSRGTRVP
ncbi:MAG: hypothetical protein LBP92_05280 [Deltaproteobacteria bacterium]|nr:hypothetical protein [Deltaproteobacteria bacterium]